jgi:hypothetical protein
LCLFFLSSLLNLRQRLIVRQDFDQTLLHCACEHGAFWTFTRITDDFSECFLLKAIETHFNDAARREFRQVGVNEECSSQLAMVLPV